MYLEFLEPRDCPVDFAFAFDPSVPAAYRPVIEEAGAYVGSHLTSRAVVHVPVALIDIPDGGALAYGGPGVGILIDNNLSPQFDLFTITIHELGHVLGFLDHLPPGAGVLSPWIPAGQRLYYTAADWGALEPLGWGVPSELVRPTEPFVLALAGADGLSRTYIITSADAVQITPPLPFHVMIEDVDGDGYLDVRFAPILVGTTWAVSGRDGSLLDGPRMAVGSYYLLARFQNTSS